MVDYVAVLRRTIDALPKNTPDIRERVYAKARQTVQSKLAMINPAPSQALIDRQMSGLETAIGTVEADFAVAIEPEALPVSGGHEADPLADILNTMQGSRQTPARGEISNADALSWQPEAAKSVLSELPPQPPVASRQAEAAAFELPDVQQKSLNTDAFPFELPDLPDRPRLPETATLDFPDPQQPVARTDSSFDDVFGGMPDLPPARNSLPSMPSLDEPVMPPVFTRPARPKAKSGRVLMPLLGLALLGGVGAAAWFEKDRIIALLKPEQPPVVAVQPDAPVQPAEPVTAPAETPAAPAEAAVQKFTQRLNSDGTEIDAGTGTSGGEQSVAQLEPAAQPETPVTPVEPATPAETPAAEPPAVTPPAAETPVAPVEPAMPSEAIPVGQKAIFYEERTSGAEGSARTGAVVWSVVRESPGNDRPPEPAVRGELTIPEAGLNVRMTLRRNADATLPASHILELIMTVPDDFSGGTIEDVQRVNLKPSEESAGAPLTATPVKVADKFFLVALENTPAAIAANLALLRDQSWIDLPVVYRTGRRALFTMEKGLVGDQVFKQVLDAWAAAPLK